MQSLSDKIKFIEKIFGKCELPRDCKNASVNCPICKNTNSNKKKLAIRLDDFAVHCWVCGYKSINLAHLIKKYNYSYFEEYKNTYNIITYEFLNKNNEQQKEKLSLPSDFCLLNSASKSDPDFRAVYNYVLKRELSTNEIDKWYLGVSNELRWKRRVIVPSFTPNGELNYFVARTCDNILPKYDGPDYSKNDIIFNHININWDNELVICEGVFDMFNCGDNVVPLLGSDLNEVSLLFNMIVTNNTPISLALDGDMWSTKTLSIAKKLYENNIDVKIVDTRSMPDPGSVSKEIFNNALLNAERFSWNNSFKTRLSEISNFNLSI